MSTSEASVVRNGKLSVPPDQGGLSNEHPLLDEMPNERTGNELLEDPPVIQIEVTISPSSWLGLLCFCL